ncbi:four helix bundle protein [Compostibacter hankyongensis]
MRDYKKLDVWNKAHGLTLMIYKEILPSLPDYEKYDLASQLKRATYSIPLNIVEGCGKYTDKDFTHFLDNALGSVHEVEYCGLLSAELGYLNEEQFKKIEVQVSELKAMLISFIKFLRKEKH